MPVPSAPATRAVTTAMSSDVTRASVSDSRANTSPYHLSVKPCQTTLRRLSLKLNTMSVISGA